MGPPKWILILSALNMIPVFSPLGETEVKSKG